MVERTIADWRRDGLSGVLEQVWILGRTNPVFFDGDHHANLVA